MRTTVPRFCGICRRGPSVGSAGCDAIGAGVSLVRQISVETLFASRGLTWMNGDGPSEITTALPRASWPVTTRRIVLGIAPSPNIDGGRIAYAGAFSRSLFFRRMLSDL